VSYPLHDRQQFGRPLPHNKPMKRIGPYGSKVMPMVSVMAAEAAIT
jgi:hypothetical protein